MKTEQELKDRCAPEFIKCMCEIAEGYKLEFDDDGWGLININEDFYYLEDVTKDMAEFPLLIHRAVEGWNKLKVCNPIHILSNCVSYITDKNDPVVINYGFDDNQYQPQSLTQAECAMLHCLLDIFEEEKK